MFTLRFAANTKNSMIPSIITRTTFRPTNSITPQTMNTTDDSQIYSRPANSKHSQLSKVLSPNLSFSLQISEFKQLVPCTKLNLFFLEI